MAPKRSSETRWSLWSMLFIRRVENLAQLRHCVLGSAEPLGTWSVWELPRESERAVDEDTKSSNQLSIPAPFPQEAGTSPGSEWSH